MKADSLALLSAELMAAPKAVKWGFQRVVLRVDLKVVLKVAHSVLHWVGHWVAS